MLTGGLLGIAAAAGGVGVAAHFSAVAAAGALAGMLAARALVVEPRHDGTRLLAWPGARLAGLAGIAFCAFLIDGTAINWSAMHVRAEGAGPALAAAGFTAFALAVAVSRAVGDRVIARHGRGSVVRCGGALAAVAALAVVVAPAPRPAIAAWALLGAGVALVAPAVLGAAGSASALPPGVAIAAVTTVGYLGSFTGPPAIGALAELTSLSGALGLVVAAALAIALLARGSLERR